MRVELKEYTVTGMIEGMEKALEDAERELVRAQSRVYTLEGIISEVKEHCGVDGCVERFWDKDRMLKHREQEHPQPDPVFLGV